MRIRVDQYNLNNLDKMANICFNRHYFDEAQHNRHIILRFEEVKEVITVALVPLSLEHYFNPNQGMAGQAIQGIDQGDGQDNQVFDNILL